MLKGLPRTRLDHPLPLHVKVTKCLQRIMFSKTNVKCHLLGSIQNVSDEMAKQICSVHGFLANLAGEMFLVGLSPRTCVDISGWKFIHTHLNFCT